MSGFERVAAELAEAGRTTYGAWSADAYAALVDDAATRFWQTIGGEASDATAAVAATTHLDALRAYLRLGSEALAQGVISESGETHGLLGHLWLETIPAHAASVPIEGLPGRLIELWNLGEGLRGEGLWLDRAIGRRVDSQVTLSEVEVTVELLLEEILSPGSDPTWEHNPSEIVDVRPISDAFVPGWMHLLAPRVVCIHDRRRDDECVGLWLESGGGGELLGCIDCGDTHHDPRPVPKLDLSASGAVKVGKHYALLPLMGELHTSLPVPAGFFVASAVDSQRVWVVGSG